MGEPEPRNYGSRALTELALYALSALVLLYVLAAGWLLTALLTGQVSSIQGVCAIIALGLAAPVGPWALRQALRLQAKQSTRTTPGAFDSLARQLRPTLRRAGQWLCARWGGGGGRISPERAYDVGIAVLSISAFWAFYAGSLVAAVFVPVAVHWLRRYRE
ncbi:MAG: hypothetical protein WA892_06370 [Ornithinimicrobium sp.]